MDPELFARITSEIEQQQQQSGQGGSAPPPAPSAGPLSASDPGAEVQGPELPPAAPPLGGDPSQMSPEAKVGAAIVAGGAKALLEVKDFIFGEPGEGEKSETRRSVESLGKAVAKEGAGYALVEGVSQFAVGMVGASKIIWASKGLRSAGELAKAVTATRAGRLGAESAKAASVGAIAFDPHEERLSDLLEKFPALSNPVTRYLQSDPNDSAAEGRLKNAMESLGLDAALLGTVAASVKLYRFLKAPVGGEDVGRIKAAERELEAAQARLDEGGDATNASNSAGPPRDGGVGPLHDGSREPQAIPSDPALPRDGGGEGPAGPAGDAAPVPDAPAGGGGQALDPDVAAFGPRSPGMPRWDVSIAGVEGRELPGDGTLSVTQVPNPTAAGAPKQRFSLVPVDGATAEGLVKALRVDQEALQAHGSWQGAIEAGYRFSSTESIPWQKLTASGEPQTAVDALRALVMEGFKPELDAMKGGAVQSDRLVRQLVDHRVEAFGADPAAVLGQLVKLGEGARFAAANSRALDYIAAASFREAQKVTAHINNGFLGPYADSIEGAKEYLINLLSVGATAQGSSDAIVSNGARAVRGRRREFRLDEDMVAAMKGLDPVALANLVEKAGGRPKDMTKLLQPSLWKTGMDWTQYLYINGLLWNPRTHFVNFTTNTYMLLARPAERIIGGLAQAGVGNEAGIRTAQEALRQYTYMGSALLDAWTHAKEAWRLGDSIMTPHGYEMQAIGGSGIGKEVAQTPFKPVDGVGALASNALWGVAKVQGVPTRMLGAVDELMKQTVYRSKVAASAHVDGASKGLSGPALRQHVEKALDDAFDEAGRAVNLKAIEEARIATFQQDLLPGTVGMAATNAVSTLPILRFVLPFVRTPTNVFRMGWKLTPILNIAQREYRAMFMGKMGQEAQAQAIGQMTTGTAFLSAASYLAASGGITGGGPTNPQQRDALLATGWRPYSIVSAGADGAPVYTPYNWYDPIGLVFGLIADGVDIGFREGYGDAHQGAAEEVATAIFYGIARNLSNKVYLVGLSKFMEAVVDPNPDGKLGRFTANLAGSLVPMSSGLRFINQVFIDDRLREARSMIDGMKANIPGLSTSLPAKRDAWGDARTVHPGLWSSGKTGIVDREIARMVDEASEGPGAPQPTLEGVDLRALTLADGSNAYEKYQDLARQPSPGMPTLKEQVATLMGTKGYQQAPDGAADTRGTKMFMIGRVMSRYREAAQRRIRADPNFRQEASKKVMAAADHYARQRTPDPAPPSPAERAGASAGALIERLGAGGAQ